MKEQSSCQDIHFSLGESGYHVSLLSFLLCYLLQGVKGWQGVKFKLEQVAQKERKKACPCQHLKVALLKSLILECHTVCPVDVWPHNMAQN